MAPACPTQRVGQATQYRFFGTASLRMTRGACVCLLGPKPAVGRDDSCGPPRGGGFGPHRPKAGSSTQEFWGPQPKELQQQPAPLQNPRCGRASAGRRLRPACLKADFFAIQILRHLRLLWMTKWSRNRIFSYLWLRLRYCVSAKSNFICFALALIVSLLSPCKARNENQNR